MNRINRVTSILIQLQSKKIIPAKEIAQRFNISLRTVYRDIRTLEEAGIPIGSEAGKGYFLVEGFLLPPVMFTAAEVGALITAGKFLNCHGDESFIKDFDSAMYKITRLHHSNVILLSACFHISDCWSDRADSQRTPDRSLPASTGCRD